jgi:drug/metabolite transporter (DMT)-like permease
VRWFAAGESILATLIWASSFIIAKVGLNAQIGALTMGGLRYTLAGLLLLPLLFGGVQSIQRLSPRLWGQLLLIGLLAHGIGNGALFWALNFLSPTTLTFLSCFLPVFILVLGIVQLRELPTSIQLAGLVVTLLGSLLFFSFAMGPGEWLGLAIALIGLLSFSYSTVLGRAIARERQTSIAALTGLPLLFGGAPLLIVALLGEGVPVITTTALWVVATLTVLNTVVAYWLYNHSMQVLTAFETNIFLNLSPLGTAVLDWWLFGARLTPVQVVGMLVVILGVTLVQWSGPTKPLVEQVEPST